MARAGRQARAEPLWLATIEDHIGEQALMPIEIRMPELAPDIAEADLIAWLVEPGAAVALGEPIAEIETDKATVEIEAPGAGILREILVPEGSLDVAVGTVLGLMETSEGDPPARPDRAVRASGPNAAPPATDDAAPPAKTSDPGSPLAAPPPPQGQSEPSRRTTALARRLAERAGIDIDSLPGSGLHGRVTRKDVERGTLPLSDAGSAFLLRLEADCRANRLLAALDELAATGSAVPLEAAIVRAAALALRGIPELSGAGQGDEDPGEPSCDIALSRGSADGQTRVIRQADRKGLATLSAELAALPESGSPTDPAATPDPGLRIVYLDVEGVDRLWPDNPPGTALGLGVTPPYRRSDAGAESGEASWTVSVTLCADTRIVPANAAGPLLAAIRRLLEHPLEMAL
jgi:pyruvate dehydrogenase E2 component (dihydrolipoamide acetyltransferase)